MASSPAAAGVSAASAPRALRLAFASSIALLLWSFVAGGVYLLGLQGGLPFRTDALSGARARTARGDAAGAIREYERAIRIDATDSRAVYELATLLLDNGRPDEAETALAAAPRSQMDDGRMLASLGNVRLAQRRYAEAVGFYRRALQLSPREPVLLNNLGTAYARLGALDDAIAAYRASTEILPGPAARNLERALRERGAR